MASARGDRREAYDMASLLDLNMVWPSEPTISGEEMKLKFKELAVIFIPLDTSVWESGTDIEYQTVENFKVPEFMEGCLTEDAKKSWSFFVHTVSSAARILNSESENAPHGEDEDSCHLCIEMVLKDNAVPDDDVDTGVPNAVEAGWEEESDDERQAIGSPANGNHINAQSIFDDPQYKDRCKLKFTKAILKPDNVIGMRM